MSDGTTNFPIRTTDPESPTAGRVKLYNKNGVPYYIDENGVAKTLKGDAGLETLPLLQARNTSTVSLTTTPEDIPFETTELETDSSTLNHDDTDREKIYALVSAFYLGALNMAFTNTTAFKREITVGIYLNGVTELSSISFKISANSDKLVTRTLFLPEVPINSYFTIKIRADANSSVTFKPTSAVTLMGTKGVVGPSGIDGADGDITWESAWTASDYIVNQAVGYLGSSYVCRINTTAQQIPTDTGYWDLMASKGDIGLTGATGSIAEDTAEQSTPIEYTSSSGLITANAMALSPDAGRHQVSFNSQYSSSAESITANANTDLIALISDINALPVDNSRASAFGTETVFAGVYTISAAATATTLTTLTLDAQGDADAIFVFRIGSTFTTGVGFNVVLADGANANNVFFVSVGAISLGATNTLKGNFLCGGTITIGAGCNIEGRVASTLGLVTLSSSVIYTPAVASGQDLRSLEAFVIYTASGAVTNALVSTITGDIGTNLGLITGFTTSTVDGGYYTSASLGSTITFGIYLDDVLVDKSDRVIIRREAVHGDVIHMYSMITITTGQILDIKILVSSGSITIGNRSITALKVG